MNKFNTPRRNIARERRAKRTERRKAASSSQSGLKLSSKTVSTSISGKKQRKLVKKWRKAQRDALESGLVTMQDIEMMAADGEAGGSESLPKVKAKKNKRVFNVKKRAKMRLKLASGKGKSITESTPADADGDTMMQ